MTLQEIIEENYASIVKRGLIYDGVPQVAFTSKILEECTEFVNAAIYGNGFPDEELADIILVCLNYAAHYGIDIQTELENKIQKNYERANNSTTKGKP